MQEKDITSKRKRKKSKRKRPQVLTLAQLSTAEMEQVELWVEEMVGKCTLYSMQIQRAKSSENKASVYTKINIDISKSVQDYKKIKIKRNGIEYDVESIELSNKHSNLIYLSSVVLLNLSIIKINESEFKYGNLLLDRSIELAESITSHEQLYKCYCQRAAAITNEKKDLINLSTFISKVKLPGNIELEVREDVFSLIEKAYASLLLTSVDSLESDLGSIDELIKLIINFSYDLNNCTKTSLQLLNTVNLQEVEFAKLETGMNLILRYSKIRNELLYMLCNLNAHLNESEIFTSAISKIHGGIAEQLIESNYSHEIIASVFPILKIDYLVNTKRQYPQHKLTSNFIIDLSNVEKCLQEIKRLQNQAEFKVKHKDIRASIADLTKFAFRNYNKFVGPLKPGVYNEANNYISVYEQKFKPDDVLQKHLLVQAIQSCMQAYSDAYESTYSYGRYLRKTYKLSLNMHQSKLNGVILANIHANITKINSVILAEIDSRIATTKKVEPSVAGLLKLAELTIEAYYLCEATSLGNDFARELVFYYQTAIPKIELKLSDLNKENELLQSQQQFYAGRIENKAPDSTAFSFFTAINGAVSDSADTSADQIKDWKKRLSVVKSQLKQLKKKHPQPESLFSEMKHR